MVFVVLGQSPQSFVVMMLYWIAEQSRATEVQLKMSCFGLASIRDTLFGGARSSVHNDTKLCISMHGNEQIYLWW